MDDILLKLDCIIYCLVALLAIFFVSFAFGLAKSFYDDFKDRKGK